MEISLHDPLTSAMRDVRKALLHHPPRTPVRADKLVNREVPTRPYPSQEQLDRLIGVMSERLHKLFSGLVYQTGGGPPVEPAGAFQVDAGLLYAILAVHFRHPTDGWREIMDKSLGDYRSAMSNEEDVARDRPRVSPNLAAEPGIRTAGCGVEDVVRAGLRRHGRRRRTGFRNVQRRAGARGRRSRRRGAEQLDLEVLVRTAGIRKFAAPDALDTGRVRTQAPRVLAHGTYEVEKDAA